MKKLLIFFLLLLSSCVFFEEPVYYGEFTYSFEEGVTEEHEVIREMLEANDLYGPFLENINEVFYFPESVHVYFISCEEENAWYDPELMEIVMCYNLIEYMGDLVYSQEIYTDDEAVNITLDATAFIFIHELGHALTDILDLPVTGKEEDAVDQLATVISVEGDYSEVALSGAYFFALQAESELFETDIEDLAYWDVHSLDAQRFFEIICLVYGSDTEYYDYLVEDELLPEERADTCEDEYIQISNSWAVLLDEHTVE